jgi:dihydrodipicolinate synthase/N-acetylneuraminate lyase
MLLEGIFTAATTCFSADGKLFLHKFERNIERYARTAISGIVVLGSTGEAVMLSDGESRDVLKAASNAAAPDKVLIAGVGQESLVETLRLAEYAAEHGYDAVLVRTPHFYRPQMRAAEMSNFYRMVADRSALPVLLYSIPSFTLYDLPVEVVGELAHHPNIIGIKDSSGKVERIQALVDATKDAPKRNVMVTPTFMPVTSRMTTAEAEASAMTSANFISLNQLGTGDPLLPAMAVPAVKTRTKEIGFQVIGGSAHTMLSSFHVGATGAVLALAAFAPQSCAEVHMAFKDRDAILEKEKQERLVNASTRICAAMGIPGIKYACDLNGYYGGVPRLPLMPLTAPEQQEVEALLASIRS